MRLGKCSLPKVFRGCFFTVRARHAAPSARTGQARPAPDTSVRVTPTEKGEPDESGSPLAEDSGSTGAVSRLLPGLLCGRLLTDKAVKRNQCRFRNQDRLSLSVPVSPAQQTDLWAEQPSGSLTRPGWLRLAAHVRAGLGGIFLCRALTTLSELPNPLAHGLAYLRQFSHPKHQHKDDHDDEEFSHAQMRNNSHLLSKKGEPANSSSLSKVAVSATIRLFVP